MTQSIAASIDHTLLTPEATPLQIEQICDEARTHGFASVCVHPVYVRRAHRMLKDSAVKTCTVVGFPCGSNSSIVKTREAVHAMEEGADELDIVLHLPALLDADYDAIHGQIVEWLAPISCERSDAVVKVIIETGLLLHDVSEDVAEHRLATACRAIHDAGADFVKTSTGFHPAGGATVQAVRWLDKHRHGLKIKASGGIRTAADARAMIDAGADRIGTSAGVRIVAESA